MSWVANGGLRLICAAFYEAHQPEQQPQQPPQQPTAAFSQAYLPGGATGPLQKQQKFIKSGLKEPPFSLFLTAFYWGKYFYQ
jgi:hypothetical protein